MTSLTNSSRKSWKLSAAERRQLKAEIALGERNARQLASKFGLSHDYVRQFTQSHREEIEEIKKEVLEEGDLAQRTDSSGIIIV